MNILHITPSYKPAFVYGGPTLSVSQLCEHQAAAGAEVTVVTTTANGVKDLPVQQSVTEGVSVYYFKRITGDHTHFSPTLLFFIWKHSKAYDIVHIHSWWNLVSVLATLVCWLKGIKPVLSPRGMLSSFSFTHENSTKKKMIHACLGKWLLKHTYLHATSQLEWQDAHRIYAQWQGFILPNIIHLPNLDCVKKKSDTLRLIFLSRIHPKKGLELTFEALSHCNFSYQLDIYGEGEASYMKELKVLAEKLGISAYISWRGWVTGQAKFEALANADIFILTSYNENFANVVLEALATKTPVLLSNLVGLSDYVEEKNYGWVAEASTQDIINTLAIAQNSFKHIKINHQELHKDFGGQYLAGKYMLQYQNLSNSFSKVKVV